LLFFAGAGHRSLHFLKIYRLADLSNSRYFSGVKF